jgi:ABC-type transporter Mla subunit MlaD
MKDASFKWACLGVAVVFLSVIVWMVNDIRLQVRRSAGVVDAAGQSIHEHLPAIVRGSRQAAEVLAHNLPEVVEKTRRTTDALADNLPRIVEQAGKTAEALADLAEDVRQLKELAGLDSKVRDQNLVAYANSVLKKVETSGGTVGKKKTIGHGLKNARPAAEWAVGARKEALLLSLLVGSKKEMLRRLARTAVLGSDWYIQTPGKPAVTLYEWIKENHPESRGL